MIASMRLAAVTVRPSTCPIPDRSLMMTAGTSPPRPPLEGGLGIEEAADLAAISEGADVILAAEVGVSW